MAAEYEITPGTVKTIYSAYTDAMEERRITESFGDKVSGWFAGGNKKDPMQDDFAAKIEEAMQSLSAGDPDSASVYEILYYMYTVPQDYASDSAIYFMLLAVQRYTACVIPLLTAQDAASLLAEYEEAVPKRDRVPVVKDLMKQLKKQAKK